MFHHLLEWALHVVIASFVLLLLSIVLWFLWNVLMGLFHGPQLPFFDMSLFAALVAIAVGNWKFSVLHAQRS